MTFPDSCYTCNYSDIDVESPMDEDYVAVYCKLKNFWVDYREDEDPTLPYWCPLKEMWFK